MGGNPTRNPVSTYPPVSGSTDVLTKFVSRTVVDPGGGELRAEFLVGMSWGGLPDGPGSSPGPFASNEGASPQSPRSLTSSRGSLALVGIMSRFRMPPSEKNGVGAAVYTHRFRP